MLLPKLTELNYRYQSNITYSCTCWWLIHNVLRNICVNYLVIVQQSILNIRGLIHFSYSVMPMV